MLNLQIWAKLLLIKHSPSKFIEDTKVFELQRIYVLNGFFEFSVMRKAF